MRSTRVRGHVGFEARSTGACGGTPLFGCSVASAVLQTAFLGDMILTTPLLERLAQRGPVHVVATPANAGILANHPAVGSIIVFDKRGGDRGLAGMRRVAAALRATGATRAYLAQGSIRTATIARLAGIPERVGFATSPGRVLYTRQVRVDRGWHHAVRLWHLASSESESETTPTQRVRPSLYPGAADVAQVDALLSSNAVAPTDFVVALAPGSVWATKRWPSYDALAVALAASLDVTSRIVVLGGPDDRALASAIAAAVSARGGPPIVDATGRLTLLASAALLARARVLVTNDSAPLHLASAMNTPTVALFGPTVPAFGFGPLAERSTVLEVTTLSCRPCHAHGPKTCPLTHWRCMRELTADGVRDTVGAMLSDT